VIGINEGTLLQGREEESFSTNDESGLNSRSLSFVKGPQAIAIENVLCELGSWAFGGQGNANISLTTKHDPLPFFPFSATIAPGKMESEPEPSGTPRNFRLGSNRRATRNRPDPIEREDSRKIDPSASFEDEEMAEASASPQIRPTTKTSSCKGLSLRGERASCHS